MTPTGRELCVIRHRHGYSNQCSDLYVNTIDLPWAAPEPRLCIWGTVLIDLIALLAIKLLILSGKVWARGVGTKIIIVDLNTRPQINTALLKMGRCLLFCEKIMLLAHELSERTHENKSEKQKSKEWDFHVFTIITLQAVWHLRKQRQKSTIEEYV